MNNSTIRLSFILPFYNVERYIGECLESIYNQNIPEEQYEVICVNDCSPDYSEQIVLQYAQSHANLKLIRHDQNKKLGAARNTGLKAAQGKYVWFVDTDDYIEKNCLQYLLDVCESNNLDVLHWSIQTNRGKWLYKFEDTGVITGIEDLISGSREITCPWNRIYNREFLVNNNLYFNDLRGGDVIHTILATNAANRLMNKSNCYYYYRKDNMNSAMNQPPTANKVISYLYIMTEALDDSKKQMSSVLFPIIDIFVKWRVNKSFKQVLRMSLKEKRAFFYWMRNDIALRDFVLNKANVKVRFMIRCPMAIYIIHPFYKSSRSIYYIVKRLTGK